MGIVGVLHELHYVSEDRSLSKVPSELGEIWRMGSESNEFDYKLDSIHTRNTAST